MSIYIFASCIFTRKHKLKVSVFSGTVCESCKTVCVLHLRLDSFPLDKNCVQSDLRNYCVFLAIAVYKKQMISVNGHLSGI